MPPYHDEEISPLASIPKHSSDLSLQPVDASSTLISNGKPEYNDVDLEADPELNPNPDAKPSPKRTRWIKRLCVTFGIFVLMAVLLMIQSSSAPTVDATNQGPPAKRKAVILAAMSYTNVTWLSDVPPDWEIYTYIADDPFAPLTVPRNQGREAMVYTTFLIDHYDNLPDYMLFIHGHERAWHQPEPMPFIMKALNYELLDELGWASLRCTLQNTCETPETHIRPFVKQDWLTSIIRGYYEYVFHPEDPWYEPLPEEFAAPCCAQFAVTKTQVQTRPHEFWKRLRAPMERSLRESFPQWNIYDDNDDLFGWHIGGAFEVTWHWLFGKDSIVCLDREYCRDTVFQGKIHCDGRTWDFYDEDKYQNITCTLDE